MIQNLVCRKIECFSEALNFEQDIITYLEVAGFHVPSLALSYDPNTNPGLWISRSTSSSGHVILIQTLICWKIDCFIKALNF
ncbi:hypothetical protein V1477_016807 [Vespula maculifrons]|uniref:Uncharacterized protein n=1 Tax=Vespula maculifrons TaxID=7453 RepID=A0ABD2B493_VESMC